MTQRRHRRFCRSSPPDDTIDKNCVIQTNRIGKDIYRECAGGVNSLSLFHSPYTLIDLQVPFADSDHGLLFALAVGSFGPQLRDRANPNPAGRLCPQ